MPDGNLVTLTGHVAVVTGASRGIGAASARVLAAAGAELIVLGREDGADLQAVREELSTVTSVVAWACDSSKPEDIRETYRRIRSDFGRLDVLVNNAGAMTGAFIGTITEDLIDQTLAVNTSGPILHLQAASRLMRKSGGSIVNMTSIIGRKGNPGQVVYAASKAAVIGMTLSAAKELASKGIRVNAIAPGFIDTDMTSALPPDNRERTLASIGLGRAGTPEDVAKVVLFLASDMSAYLTGQVIGVDGGMLI